MRSAAFARGAAACVCLAVLAGFCSSAWAERDADFIAKLRQGGFTQIAEYEVERLLAKTDLDENTRVALLLEKARILENKAMALQLDEAAQIDLIHKAQAVLKPFITQYANRPEKTDASYELQFLNCVLGLLYVRQAQFESDANAQNQLITKGRGALDEATAGYAVLRQEFEKRRDGLKAELQAQRDLYDKENAKIKPDRAAMKTAERRIAELGEKMSSAEISAIQCRYLEADSVGGLGRALKKTAGHEAEGDAFLDKAVALYNGIFNDYKKTVYIETAYRGLGESVRIQSARGQGEAAYKRIQSETYYFLTTYRQEVEKEPAFKRIAAQLHLATAEVLNGTGKYKEARDEATLAGGGPQSPVKDEADIEIAKSYKGEGNMDKAATMLGDVIGRDSAAQRDAMDLVLQWLKESPGISSKFSTEVQFSLAMLLYNERRYAEADRVLSGLVQSSSGADKAKWDMQSLLYIAQCRGKQAEARKAQLAAAHKDEESKAAYIAGLKDAVSVVMDQLVSKYGGEKSTEAQAVLRRALYFALDWQNQVVRLGDDKAQKARFESVLETFNKIFPGATNIPDANFLRGASLESEGRYKEAMEAYAAVAPERNQSVVAKLRITFCAYRLYRQKKGQTAEEFTKLWNELKAGMDAAKAKMADAAARIEESEKPQFTMSIMEGEYIRALLLFYATDAEAATVLEAGAKKCEEVIDLSSEFMKRYPDSPYQSQVVFMLVRSKIEAGKEDAAEADVERLKGQRDLYQNALAALRDSYFNLYLEAQTKQDKEAVKKTGEKYINYALRFAQEFSEAVTAGDKVNMGDYMYQAGRLDEAAKLLGQAWESFDGVLRNQKDPQSEDAARTKSALRIVGEKLGEVLVWSDDVEKVKKAGEVYGRLFDFRREELKAKFKNDPAGFEKGLGKDALANRYMTRGAMATVSIQAHAGKELEGMEALVGAVGILEKSERMHKPLTREWWLIEYWVARGMVTQRDLKMATKVCENVRAMSGDFKPQSGAEEAAFGGKTFKELFKQVSDDIEKAEKPQD
jgi:TolA-binding protein